MFSMAHLMSQGRLTFRFREKKPKQYSGDHENLMNVVSPCAHVCMSACVCACACMCVCMCVHVYAVCMCVRVHVHLRVHFQTPATHLSMFLEASRSLPERAQSEFTAAWLGPSCRCRLTKAGGLCKPPGCWEGL